MTQVARSVQRENIRQLQQQHALIVLQGKLLQVEALHATLAQRESMLGVQILAGLNVCFVQVESLPMKEKTSVMFARMENRATQGHPRVQIVAKDNM